MKSLPLSAKIVNKYEVWKKEIQAGRYCPFLTVRSLNSAGTSSIIWSPKTGRCHHLLSQGELHAFLYIESLPQVIDIREQFALNPTRTFRLAERAGIRHPGSPKLGSITPVTTDFLVRLRCHARTGWCAIAHKPRNILLVPTPKGRLLRQVNSLRLEQLYWSEFDVPWALSVVADYDRREIYNIEFVRPHRMLSAQLRPTLPAFASHFQEHWAQHPDAPLADLVRITATALKLTLPHAYQVFRWLAWQRRLPINLRGTLELYLPLPRLEVRSS